MSVGKYAEAEKVLQKIAKSNKRQIPERLLEEVAKEERSSHKRKESARVWRILAHRILLIRTLIIAFNRSDFVTS